MSSDPRFARLATDPRFRRPKQKKVKVEIDERFKDVLKGDGDFGTGPEGKKGKKLDKYGRPLATSHDADQLKHFYRLRSPSPSGSSPATTSGLKQKTSGDSAPAFVDYARGEGLLESSGSEDEDDDEESEARSTDDEEVVITDPKSRRRQLAVGRHVPPLTTADSESEEEDSDEEEDHLQVNLSEDSDAEVEVAPTKESKKSASDRRSPPRSAFPDEEDIAAQQAAEEEENAIEPTKRIAIVNLDWDNMRAIDLYKVFTSVLEIGKDPKFAARRLKSLALNGEGSGSKLSQEDPPQGKLLSVRIYPSEFGKERMAREDQEGPAAEVFGSKSKTHKRSSEDSDLEDSDGSEDEDDLPRGFVKAGPSTQSKRKGRSGKEPIKPADDGQNDSQAESESDESEVEDDEQAQSFSDDEGSSEYEDDSESDIDETKGEYEIDNQDEEVDMDKLRQYQLDRLRYYYAIATFSSISAARYVFKECNGTEFERTANIFDLSYVPDEMSFDDNEPEDEATEDEKNYRGNDFVTDALRHSKVKLTWDQDDPNRVKLLRKALSKQEIEENDFKAYLASSDDEDDAEEERTDRLRDLLLGGGSSEDVWGKKLPDMEDDEGLGDMEITFTPGLSKPHGTANDDDDRDMTTIERYKARMKEKVQKKKEKKELKAKMREDGNAEDDDFFGEPDDESATAVADAERVIDFDSRANAVDDDAKHFSLTDILKAEIQEGKKKKKQRLRKKKGGVEREVALGDENFKVDVKDDRFKAIFDEPAFAIDPSNPKFIKTKGMTDLLQERNNRRKDQPAETGSRFAAQSAGHAGTDGSQELHDLASSVKRAMQESGTADEGAKKKRRRRH